MRFTHVNRLRGLFLLLLVSAAFFPVTSMSAQSPNDPPLTKWENLLLEQPNPERIRASLRTYTSKPHMAGTPEDYETAVFTRDELRKAGIQAELAEFEVWLPYPKSRLVEVVGPEKYTAALTEPALKEDPDSANSRAVPTYAAYSASGDVTADVVYANFGSPADFDLLKKNNIDVTGKIVLVRYGGNFRGVKPKVAEERGAVGVLIYSDPKDDGYVQGDKYPLGPFRADNCVQRGSVQYLFQQPGDPLTPNGPSIPGTKRIDPSECKTITKLPVQPLSYRDALPILEQLSGPNVPPEWQGGLPLAYHMGPGPAKVRIKLEMDYQQRKIWNVIGTIPGATLPDEWVILGNHRDAWVFGAVDPSSGSATMLEVGRAFGALLKAGWKPARTIKFGSWDGEEFGLIGSTEWVEQHAAELSKKAVMYLNVDSAISGENFGASAVPSTWEIVKATARAVPDGEGKQSLYANWRSRTKNNAEVAFGQLGSGSDFTPFLQHLGIPAVDMGMSGKYGVYHSTYDSFHWMEKFGDPAFTRHAAMARMWGLLALRFADAPDVPLDLATYGKELLKYAQELEAEFRNVPGTPDFSVVTAAARRVAERAEAFDKTPSTEATRAMRNDARRRFERMLIAPDGLPVRPWYRHVVYAPGYYLGYGAEIFSGLRHSLSRKDAADSERATKQIVEAFTRAADVLSPGTAGASGR